VRDLVQPSGLAPRAIAASGVRLLRATGVLSEGGYNDALWAFDRLPWDSSYLDALDTASASTGRGISIPRAVQARGG